MAASVRAVFPSGTTATVVGTATTITTSVTVVAGDVLEAHVVVNSGADSGLSVSATANGVAADGSSVAVHSNGQNAGFERVFYWLTPSAGTYNVVATVTGGTPDVLGQKCYAVSGSNQSAPAISTFAPSGTGNSTAVSITSPTMPTGSVGISHFCGGGSFSSTGQTTQVIQSLGGSAAANEMAGASAAGTGGTTNFTATMSVADWWAAIATVWSQAGGGGGGPTEDPNQAAHWLRRPPGHLAPSTALVGPSGSAQAPPIVTPPPYFTSWSDGTTPELIVSAEDWGVLANGGLNHSGDFAATYTDYFATRQGQGYNCVMVSVFGYTGLSGGTNGADSDGTYPFTPNTDPSGTPNSTYWGRRDAFLTTAAAYGFRVLLNVTTPSLGGGAFPASWTNTQWTNFGTFLGNRYASQSNILWMVGDDYFGTVDTGLTAFLSALRAAGANQPISIQNYQETASRKDIYNGSTLSWGNTNAQYNFGYSYNVSYDVVEKMGLEAAPLPYLWGDGFFLASSTTGITDVQLMRRMIWWALSSGSKGFEVGDNDVWPWASTSLAQITAKTFYTAVVPAIATYFRGLPNWHLLVADTASLLVTSGRGTHRAAIQSGGAATGYTDDSDSYVTASRTPTGTLAVIYMSHASSITIDESKMVAGYTATWVDPKTCARTTATAGSTYNSSSLGTNSDGQNDWLLVLQAPTTQVTATRATTWNVSAGLTSVTATRATTWTLAAAVSATRATTWSAFASVSATRATTWSALKAVSGTRATTWVVRSAVSATRATTWNAAAAVTSTRATTWNALAQVSATRATTWNVAGTLTSVTATRATTWSVTATVLATRATTWTVALTVTATRGTTWGVAVAVTSTRATTWNALAGATSTRSTTWTVQASVTATRATTWSVGAGVTSTRATTWKVASSVTSSRATTWNVASALSQVTATRATTWVTKAQATGTRVTTWTVRATISGTRATTWSVLTPVAVSARSTTWTVLARSTATRATTWTVKAAITSSRSTTWNVLPYVAPSDGGPVVNPGLILTVPRSGLILTVPKSGLTLTVPSTRLEFS